MSDTALPPPSEKRLDSYPMTFAVLVLTLLAAVLAGEPIALFPPLLGTWGDWVRAEWLLAFGFGGYVLLLGMVVLSVQMFLRKSWSGWAVRATGWVILSLVASYSLARFSPMERPIGMIGQGGVIGAWLHRFAMTRFEPVGVELIYGGASFLGVLLAADRLIVWTWFASIHLLRGFCELMVRIFSVFRFPEKKVTSHPIPPVDSPAVVAPEPIVHVNFDASNIPIIAASTEPEAEVDAIIPIIRPTAESPVSPKVAPRGEYTLPSLDLLDEVDNPVIENHDEKLREVALHLEKTFKDFGLNVKVVGIHTGPVITQYEIALETGLRVTKVTALADDLALNLRVSSVRIVAPIPGRNTVGIEVPNENRVVVRMKELATLGAPKIAKSRLPLCLGKDSEGRPLIYDLADMPHLLIAGRTGTGKSVCLNSIILSLLLTRTPNECKLLMIDPKQVELAEYGKLPHLMHPVVTDNSKAEAILSWAVDKMEERYEILRRSRVRNIVGYNDLGHAEVLRRAKPLTEEDRDKFTEKMPYIVIVIDEVGDLMMAMKKEVEGHIIRLAQKSRAAGIHLILTTQRPTVDVITGLIKSNLPARICFQVADRSNSRVVLDEMGAEKLLGQGDMLFLQPKTSTIVRAQGTYASDQEITRIVSLLEVEDPEYDAELLNLQEKDAEGTADLSNLRKRDELYEQAIEIVIREGRGSCSLLQRALGIGYGRASRLIDFMAEDGIVGGYNGSSAREVLFTMEQWHARGLGDGDESDFDHRESA